MNKPREPRRCGSCNGTGVIKEYYQDANGKWQYREKRCPACGGRGETN